MREWRGSSEVSPAVSHRVVLPRVGLGAGDLSRVVAAEDIDLASGRDVAASRKAVHIRHVRSGGPGVSRNIVDPVDVVVEAAYSVFTAEHVNLVRRRVIHCGSHDCCLRHVCHRSPGVGYGIIAIHHGQRLPRTEGVTAGSVEVCAVGSARCAIQVKRHVRH